MKADRVTRITNIGRNHKYFDVNLDITSKFASVIQLYLLKKFLFNLFNFTLVIVIQVASEFLLVELRIFCFLAWSIKLLGNN